MTWRFTDDSRTVAFRVVGNAMESVLASEVSEEILPPLPRVVGKDEQDADAARQYARLRALVAMSPAEVEAWGAANVNNLAQAKEAITTLAVAVSIFGRRI